MAILSTTINGKNVTLPAPISISVGDEIIWSSNTGRTASGKMVGDVIAEKLTLSISWGILTASDVNLIRNSLRTGFFPITFNIDGKPSTINVYRGTLTREAMGQLSDGVYYFRQVAAEIIQQ